MRQFWAGLASKLVNAMVETCLFALEGVVLQQSYQIVLRNRANCEKTRNLVTTLMLGRNNTISHHPGQARKSSGCSDLSLPFHARLGLSVLFRERLRRRRSLLLRPRSSHLCLQRPQTLRFRPAYTNHSRHPCSQGWLYRARERTWENVRLHPTPRIAFSATSTHPTNSENSSPATFPGTDSLRAFVSRGGEAWWYRSLDDWVLRLARLASACRTRAW